MSAPIPLVVMGVSGSGKSTLAEALAAQRGAHYLDADSFHPAANVEKMRAGIPLDDDDRAPWLARLNTVLREHTERGEAVVLACSALKRAYRTQIAAGLPDLRWIYLHGSYDMIAARMRARAHHYMPESLLKSQFATLEPPHDAIEVSIEWPLAQALQTVEAALGAKAG